MNEIHRKILSILDHDVICELKNAENHIPESLLFHNHDGCEIYLFLNGDVNYYTESSGKKLERGDLDRRDFFRRIIGVVTELGGDQNDVL